MRIAVTGHRPSRLGNEWHHEGPYSDYVYGQMENIVDLLKPDQMISGMALGSDMLWATLAQRRQIPLLAAIPFKGQELKWDHECQKQYHHILKDENTQITHVSEGGYSVESLLKRDRYVVDQCQILVAIFTGEWNTGTGHTIKYAQKMNKPIIYINPLFDKDQNAKFMPELGQYLFGCPTSEFECPEFIEAGLKHLAEEIERIENNKEHTISYEAPIHNNGEVYETPVFSLRAYYWGENEIEEAKPNFKYKNFEIRWYKYIGRGMSMNRKIKADEFFQIIDHCIEHVRRKEKEDDSKR